MRRVAPALTLCFLCAGCGGGEATLLVDLKTDLVPGLELDEVLVDDFGARDTAPEPTATADSDRSRRAPVSIADDFLAGQRVAEYPDTRRGDHWLRVRLLHGGAIILERLAIVSVRGHTVVTLVMTRSCRGVSCPDASGDPLAIACRGGQCVDPRCSVEDPARCPEPDCTTAADCPALRSACASSSCVDGLCVAARDDAACGDGLVCSADEGCLPPPDGSFEAPSGPFGAPTPVTALNSAVDEDDATLTGDLLEVYFLRGDTHLLGNLFTATRASPDDPWPTPVALTTLTPGGDSTLRVSRDGLRLWLARPGAAAVDQLVSRRGSRTSDWSDPVPVPELNTASDDFAANDYARGTRIVWANAIAGNHDIYMAERDSLDDSWSTPTPVAINTAAMEQDPFVRDDGLELWFISNRAGGQGNADIYRATRSSLDEPFANVVPAGGINTPSNEADPWLSPDGRLLMFASDRSGRWEIYEARR